MQGVWKLRPGISCLLVIGLFVGTALTGCSRGPVLMTVEGTVTIDGNALGQGAITFEPVDGKGRTAGGTIENGKYTAQVPPGEKRVRITGFEVTGQKPAYPGKKDGPMRDVVKELVPPKYNVKSELTLNVDASPTAGDFPLKSS